MNTNYCYNNGYYYLSTPNNNSNLRNLMYFGIQSPQLQVRTSHSGETREEYARRTNFGGDPNYAPGWHNKHNPEVHFISKF